MKHRKVLVSGLLALLFLVWHPLTRPIVLFILPLGSSPDDIIVVILFVLFVLFWSNTKEIVKWLKK